MIVSLMVNNTERAPVASIVRHSVFILIVALLLSNCTPEANPDIERGSGYNYQPGYPEANFSAVGFLDESNTPSINIAADIVYGSLIFKQVDNISQAKMAVDIRIVPIEGDNNVIDPFHDEITLTEESTGGINSQNSYIFEKSITVPPGSYTVYFTLTDSYSDKEITRQTTTSIPDPASSLIDLTDIRMLAKNMDAEDPQWRSVTTYDVKGRVDSLMFIFQATNNSSSQPLSINAKLLKFEADTSVARPMYYNNYSPSSASYRGIDYDEQQTVQQSERKLLQEGSVFIEFKFAQQNRGNYRFEVRSAKEGSDLFKARDFGIKSTNYPALKTAWELAGPLAYLMDEDEYEELTSISNSDSLKKAIDRFWLKQLGSAYKARNVIQLYYQRAEEANKQFSNFKEGWKTDTGMMYILFGPPWYVDRRLDQMQWSYSYNRTDPERNFLFLQPKLKSEFYPFEHYILQRNQQYYSVEYQQRSLWLSGLILQRRL